MTSIPIVFLFSRDVARGVTTSILKRRQVFPQSFPWFAQKLGAPPGLASPEQERPFRSNRHGGRDWTGQARDVMALRPSDQDRNRRGMDVDLKRFFSRYLEAHYPSGVPAVPIRVSALRALLSGIDDARPAPRIILLNDFGFLVEDENPILCSASYPERPPNVHDSPDPDRGRDYADCFHRFLFFA